MRLRRPNPALVVACLALLLSAGGGAYAGVRSTGSAVNIVDPVTAAAARVSGAGVLSVTGVVSTKPVPSTFVSAAALGLTTTAGCVTLLTPPAGKALVLTQVTVDTYIDPTPGVSNLVRLFKGASCDGAILATVNPPTVGASVLPLAPGAGIPAGSGVSAEVFGNVQAEAYAYGYTANATEVPARTPTDERPVGTDRQARQ